MQKNETFSFDKFSKKQHTNKTYKQLAENIYEFQYVLTHFIRNSDMHT